MSDLRRMRGLPPSPCNALGRKRYNSERLFRGSYGLGGVLGVPSGNRAGSVRHIRIPRFRGFGVPAGSAPRSGSFRPGPDTKVEFAAPGLSADGWDYLWSLLARVEFISDNESTGVKRFSSCDRDASGGDSAASNRNGALVLGQ
jgi:hypothetical protein